MNSGKDVTTLHVVMCEKPSLKVKQGSRRVGNDERKDRERISQVVICDVEKSDEMMLKWKISH